MLRKVILWWVVGLPGVGVTAHAGGASTRFDQLLNLHMGGPLSDQGALERAPGIAQMVCFDHTQPNVPLAMTIQFRPGAPSGDMVLHSIHSEQALVEQLLARREHLMSVELVEGFSGRAFVGHSFRGQSVLSVLGSRRGDSDLGFTLTLHMPSGKMMFTVFDSKTDDSADEKTACEIRRKFKVVCIQADTEA